MIGLAVSIGILGALAGGSAVLMADLRGRVRRLEEWRRAELEAARPAWMRPDPNYGPPENYGPPPE